MKKKYIYVIVCTLIVAAVAMSLLISYIIGAPANYVAVVRLEGTIVYGDDGLQLTEVITPSDVKYYVDTILRDPMAKAVVFVINSPGGSAAASEELYTYMKKLSESKPLVVYSPEVLASGGYYIALPAKKIVVSPYALVGSIGAVTTLINVAGLFEKLGINITIIKSGEYKDIGSIFRELTPEEYIILSDIVNKTAELFIKRVRENRPDVSQEVLTAKIYMGSDALAAGLVDEIGTLEDAIKIARELANLPPYTPVKTIEKPRGLLERLLRGSLAIPLEVSLRTLEEEYYLMTKLRDKILFLWGSP